MFVSTCERAVGVKRNRPRVLALPPSPHPHPLTVLLHIFEDMSQDSSSSQEDLDPMTEQEQYEFDNIPGGASADRANRKAWPVWGRKERAKAWKQWRIENGEKEPDVANTRGPSPPFVEQ